jgi:CubicO group peptidase (beta-lactamase class C family)
MQFPSFRPLLIVFVALLTLSVAIQAEDESRLADQIQRVENGIEPIQLSDNEPPVQLNIEKLMQLYRAPGVSVAVIDDFKIAWAKGYGVTEAGGSAPVTVHTLFQAASISKPVAATGSLWLVEHGKLSLDENVNLKLKSWQVPENEFTKDQKVTLRRLVSHSAGMSVHGFPGYEVGAPIPTLVQVLNGEPPANTAPVRVERVPGTKYDYSGGGITVEQLLVQDVTGEPFPQFMRDTVLDKIGMSDSGYDQPLPPPRAASAATATHSDGMSIPGKWHVYPEMAAAGLWTTPTDLAKFAIEIALSKQGKANHVLSRNTAREMLKPQIWVYNDEWMGLGLFLGDYKNPAEFGHDGSNDGFRSLLVMLGDSGKGVAIMVNSDNGVAVEDAILRSVAREYKWKYTPDPPDAASLLTLLASIRGSQAAVARYEELKKSAHPAYVVDENTLVQLGYNFVFSGKIDEAIQTFKLEVQDYPKFWNAYDSLGEAYMRNGQKELAVTNYEKSIELDPQNQNGIDMLKKLKAQK